MAFKFVIICALVAYVNAGNLLATPAVSTYAAAPTLAYQSYHAPVSTLSYQSYHAPAPALTAYHAPAPAFSYSSPLSYSAPAITSQSSNIYRSAGNLGQISTYSKTIDTPFSSVSKSDVRISNPGFRYAAAPALAYAAAPAPVVHAAPGAIGVAYSAAPAVSHISYDSGLVHYAF